MRILLFIIMAFLLPLSAQAQCPCGSYIAWRDASYGPVRHCYRCPTRVYGYERRLEDEERGECRDRRRAVGDQHLSEDGAKKAANDAWAGTIRFHLGERFMDLKNARHVVYVCSRSSIKEGGTSVTTAFQQFTRCEIEAQPCAPAPQFEVKEERP